MKMTFKYLLFLVLSSYSLATEINNHHVLLIAPPMLSHIIPSLELAKQLSNHCHVTYLISANKIDDLERKGLINAFNSSQTLDIVGLNDGNNQTLELQVEDFQINFTNMTKIIINRDLQAILYSVINRMSITLEQLFQSNINLCSSAIPCSSMIVSSSSSKSLTTRPITKPINMIIARSVTPLPLMNLSIPFYLFLPSNLRGVVNYLNMPRAKTVEEEDFYDYLRKNIDRANGFICNSLKEFDGKYLDEFYQLIGKQVPVHFVGPIVSDGQKSTENKAKEVIDWLDTQPMGSVIYIAFGSMVRLPFSALEILAKALSSYPFIWSLKTKMPLPSALMNLDPHRQLLLEWTPQRAILEHPSISFFFSHGGWNSLLEGMLHGKAILVWPFFADQFDNAEQLVDLGMARQVSSQLQIDIQSMLTNESYTNKAKQIQQLVLQARESSSKKQIADIIRFSSTKEIGHDEF